MPSHINYKLKPLRQFLWGYYPEIAKRCGVSEKTVQRVLNGEYHNQTIIDAASMLRDEIERERELSIKKLIK